MAECIGCGKDQQSCGCDKDCCVCGESMKLEWGLEWPEGDIYCWGCAHDRIYKLEAPTTKE